ncbi:hypothetical protein DES49_1785 [Halospina denitrificans]|uniref:Uncharacterized protein n=1 Tax=Halospina denitrificans TaxID=332522 RepID=A0A4R7JW60_9GAMM|nr:hypothetical protein [Halospina denitrificans]TDT41683.1 hypothetical protein DES49_1785 [Halospina denitrificans]
MPTATDKSAFSWPVLLAHILFLLAAWTLFIKYLFPVAFALAEGIEWHTYIYWDLWPIAHVWLGWALLARPGYTRALAIGMALVEIAIIVTLFWLFLADPEWSIWRTNWFVNKVFVLACFVLVLYAALRHPEGFSASR